MQKFEDIQKIDNARKITVVEPVIDQDRDRFMHSWDHRNYGIIDHDRGWKGIRLGHLRPKSVGGRERQIDVLTLWAIVTSSHNSLEYLLEEKVRSNCQPNINFCTNDRAQLFTTNYTDLDALEAAADNPLVINVRRALDMNLTLEDLLQANRKSGLLYNPHRNTFLVIDLL